MSLLVVVLLTCVSAVPPNVSTSDASVSNLQEEINDLKYTTKLLTSLLEKRDNLFLTSIASTASSLSSINSNINNLQERAHVWDTFQLHVSAWNEQLAALDRKADIISKGQEKILSIESKIDSLINQKHHIDESFAKLDNIHDSLNFLKEETQKQRDHHKCHDGLFEEFTARGILSSIKTIERKLDKLVSSQQSSFLRVKNRGNLHNLVVKCITPHFVEDLLRDISAKVDILFDRSSGKEDIAEYDVQDDGSGEIGMFLELKTDPNVTERIDQYSIGERTKRVENMTKIILDKIDINRENLEILLQDHHNSNTILETIFNKTEEIIFTKNFDKIMRSYFSEQRAHFESFLLKQTERCKNHIEPKSEIEEFFLEPAKSGCEDLDSSYANGVYIFGNSSKLNPKNRSYDQKFCLVRDDGSWTVIQNRNNYLSPQNFNLSWFEYKHGFGNLHKDFWFGNDFISKFTREKKLILRIELGDFDGNEVWAEFSKFVVLPEERGYKMMVGEYRGNASDSFSAHNNSLFSTFDRKNDQAPDCCPCAVSFGGGWWYNSCFESNLNGIYHKNPLNNGYFSGIIWEYWLGNYSLKKTVMMVKPINTTINKQQSTWPYYEDP